MKLIPFGQRSGLRVPQANIGGMRLPQDTGTAVALLRHAIDSGMRYIDTSRGYGDSEIKIGQALKDGYRQKVILSTKWSPWIMRIEESDNTSADCVRKRIEESMKRLDVDYLDYYQVWNIDSREHYGQAVAKGGMVDGIQKAISEKLVGHTGFTTHDKVENIIEYVKETDWCEIILFSCNILNLIYEKAIEAAHAKGIGIIIMNPVAGGLLGRDSSMLKALAKRVGAKTIPELAIRFLTSNPSVTTVISGISKMSDVDSTVAAVDRGHFTPAQMDLLRKILAEMHVADKVFCTGCRYCMPCSKEIDIPAIMKMIAQYRFWGFQEPARGGYRDLKSPKADACVQCGKCEEKCTQHLHIMDEMEYAIRNLASA
ncbi:MAG: aldo/keto reductase [Verrucomicrobia bacterium]|nr:aldo/keto reductase [Verrucomicrobiota bacterium]